MTIYTGRGDDGDTDLRGGKRVSKTHQRIEAYGTIDELNALLGRIRPVSLDDIDDSLETIQHHLFVLQAELADPETHQETPEITEAHVSLLEAWIDDTAAELPEQDSFLLPGGTDTGSALHHACTVCRRAERRSIALDEMSDSLNSSVVTYLNRLSDILYMVSRLANYREGATPDPPTYEVHPD